MIIFIIFATTFLFLQTNSEHIPTFSMILFLLLAMIALIPFGWSMKKTLEEKRYADVCLQAMIFVCCLGHFFMFYRKYYLMMHESTGLMIMHCTISALMIPSLYMYICKKIGAMYANNTAVLLMLAVLAFIPRGAINLDNSAVPENPMPTGLFQFYIYYGGEAVLQPMSYSLVVILQAIFSTLRTIALLTTMARKKYRYSENYKMFLYLLGVAIITVFLSYLPDDSFWYGRWTCLVLICIFMVFLGCGYVLLALKFDESPLIDENDEPVLLETPHKFTELAKKFRLLIKEQKPYLKEGLVMEDVAKILGTNRTYVAQMVKEEFGQTFSSYMNTCRVEEAKRLIEKEGNKRTLQEIAYQSGFNSVSTFNKVFKSVVGVAPSEWKG